MSYESLLASRSELYVVQKKEWATILIDWETSNRYAILGESQEPLGMVAERGGGIWKKLMRLLLRSHRPLEVDVVATDGGRLLGFTRPFFWFFSDLDVLDPSGRKLGSIHRRFAILYKRYDLRDAQGALFATIESPFWRLWTFPVSPARPTFGAAEGGRRAEISKKWGGMLSEVFTDADKFRVSFGSQEWSLEERAVIFAAAISIDFDFFEHNQGNRGILGLFD